MTNPSRYKLKVIVYVKDVTMGFSRVYGERGIWTPDPDFVGIPRFERGALVHSAISPKGGGFPLFSKKFEQSNTFWRPLIPLVNLFLRIIF